MVDYNVIKKGGGIIGTYDPVTGKVSERYMTPEELEESKRQWKEEFNEDCSLKKYDILKKRIPPKEA